MKRIIVIIAVTAILLTTFITGSHAGYGGVHGLAIGGGTGAVIGHAIGRNPEAAIIGATVGGMIGLIVGSEIDRNHRVTNHHVRRVIAPPPRHPHVYKEKYFHRDSDCPVYRGHLTRGKSYYARRHHISKCRLNHHR